MPSDSLFGGGGSTPTPVLTADSIKLLDQYLNDTIGGTSTTSKVGEGTLVVGKGANGETQGGVLPSGSGITGTMTDGTLTLTLTLPATVGMLFQGINNATPDQVSTALKAAVNTYMPGSDNNQYKQSVLKAVDDITTLLKSANVTGIVLRVVDFMNQGGGQSGAQGTEKFGADKDIVLDMSGSASNEVFAINLANANGKNVVAKGLEAAVVAGPGSFQVDGTLNTRVVGDMADQKITGGAGKDTLVGGGGHDTLIGGAGADVIGFTALGNYTLTDFNKVEGDKLAFSMAGISSVADLAKHLTGVTDTSSGVTFKFDGGASITLVGVHASDITTDLIKFTL